MKLIKPAEISAKIMTLIDDAERELIIVSPYNHITGWEKLIRRINKTKERGVLVLWYSRKNNVQENNAKEVIVNLGIQPILIEDLHAKIYMNERSAIVTSMNMSKISDDKSIDLGYITETKEEYDQVYQVYIKYINHREKPVETEDQPMKPSRDEKIRHIDLPEGISEIPYFKLIHEYITNRYGNFNASFLREPEEVLEYQDFIKPGVKLQFISYSQAVRLKIWLPPSQPVTKLEGRLLKSIKSFKLKYPNEVECYPDPSENYIKYYHPEYYRKIVDWNRSTVNMVMQDIDLFVKMVFQYIK
jgi:hypothetical protein